MLKAMWEPKIKKMNLFVRILTFGWAAGITLCPFGIYIKEGYENQRGIIVHENIHWRQQLEMLIIFFYLWYVIEWLIKIPFKGKKAYSSLSFEREANAFEYDDTYLTIRKPYAWLKYVFKNA